MQLFANESLHENKIVTHKCASVYMDGKTQINHTANETKNISFEQNFVPRADHTAHKKCIYVSEQTHFSLWAGEGQQHKKPSIFGA